MRIKIEAVVNIGRGPENEVALGDRRLSRRHCRIFRDAQGVYVQDLGSINGTRVNGIAILRTRQLRDGDVIEIGNYRFEVQGDSLFELPTPPQPVDRN